MKHYFLTVTIGSFLLFSLSETNCQSSVPKLTEKDSLEVELDKLVPGLLRKTSVPGISIAVIRNGKLFLAKSYGIADKAENKPVMPNTRFQIGSVSKTITALLVVKLASKGKINLDDPVEKYVKSWQLPEAAFDSKKVTIRRVLSHTAGLTVKGYHGVSKPGEKLPTILESLNGYRGSDGRLQLVNEPGSKFEYSSGGYTLLQLLVNEVTGKRFEEYAHEEIFEPLQLKNTGYSWTNELERTVATPYDEFGKAWPHYQYVENASGGLYTTAEDLATILTVFCPGGKFNDFINETSIRDMITPAAGTAGKYGLGCKLGPINESQTFILHDGSNEGWRAAYYIHPPSGDGIALLTNSDLGGKAGAPIICTVFKGTSVDMSGMCASLPGWKN